MRKIKFRLWDKVNEKIVQHDSLKDFIITIFGDVCYISKLKFKELNKNKQIIILINKNLLY